MQAYNKLIVAVVGMALLLLKDQLGVDLTASEDAIAEAVIAIATAAGVYFMPNKPAEPKP